MQECYKYKCYYISRENGKRCLMAGFRDYSDAVTWMRHITFETRSKGRLRGPGVDEYYQGGIKVGNFK